MKPNVNIPPALIMLAIVTVVFTAFFIYLDKIVSPGIPPQTTTTVKAVKVTTTTTLLSISAADIEALTSYRVEYRRSIATIKSVQEELKPILNKKRAKWTTREVAANYALDFDMEQAEKQRDAAVANYKALADRYGEKRLAVYGLRKGLE